MFLAKARYLPPEVILFTAYDPRVDMDEKMTHDASLQRAKRMLDLEDDGDQPRAKITRPNTSTAVTVSDRLVTPPESPESPPFELDPNADLLDVPLQSLPHGLVIHG